MEVDLFGDLESSISNEWQKNFVKGVGKVQSPNCKHEDVHYMYLFLDQKNTYLFNFLAVELDCDNTYSEQIILFNYSWKKISNIFYYCVTLIQLCIDTKKCRFFVN